MVLGFFSAHFLYMEPWGATIFINIRNIMIWNILGLSKNILNLQLFAVSLCMVSFGKSKNFSIINVCLFIRKYVTSTVCPQLSVCKSVSVSLSVHMSACRKVCWSIHLTYSDMLELSYQFKLCKMVV